MVVMFILGLFLLLFYCKGTKMLMELNMRVAEDENDDRLFLYSFRFVKMRNFTVKWTKIKRRVASRSFRINLKFIDLRDSVSRGVGFYDCLLVISSLPAGNINNVWWMQYSKFSFRGKKQQGRSLYQFPFRKSTSSLCFQKLWLYKCKDIDFYEPAQLENSGLRHSPNVPLFDKEKLNGNIICFS